MASTPSYLAKVCPSRVRFNSLIFGPFTSQWSQMLVNKLAHLIVSGALLNHSTSTCLVCQAIWYSGSINSILIAEISQIATETMELLEFDAFRVFPFPVLNVRTEKKI